MQKTPLYLYAKCIQLQKKKEVISFYFGWVSYAGFVMLKEIGKYTDGSSLDQAFIE